MRRENAKMTSLLTLMVDVISVILAFIIAALVRGGIIYHGAMSGLYGSLFIVVILSELLISNLSNNDDIFKRGFLVEFIHITKDTGKMTLIILVYMFSIKEANSYSRIFLSVFLILNAMIAYVARSYMKLFMLITYKKSFLQQ